MFSEFKNLSPDIIPLVSSFRPMELSLIEEAKERFPSCPKEYYIFLEEIGVGSISDPNEPENYPAHFRFSEGLISAELDYYKDQRIYSGGAIGDIFLFGFESTGVAYGFDSGDEYTLVEVDNYRIVKKIDLKFKDFFFGLLACYPDIPERYEAGKWYNDIGDQCSFPVISS